MPELSGVWVLFFDDEMQLIQQAEARIEMKRGGLVDVVLPVTPVGASSYQVYLHIRAGNQQPIGLCSAVLPVISFTEKIGA